MVTLLCRMGKQNDPLRQPIPHWGPGQNRRGIPGYFLQKAGVHTISKV